MFVTMEPRKIDYISVAVIAVLVVISYFAFFHRGITRYFYYKNQEKVLQENLASNPQLDKTYAELQKRIESIQSILNDFNQRLPEGKNIDDILTQVYSAAAQAGISVDTIEPQAIVQGEMYNRFPIKLYLTGTFESCFAFFARLETLPRILRLENLTMEKTGDENMLHLELLISAFILK